MTEQYHKTNEAQTYDMVSARREDIERDVEWASTASVLTEDFEGKDLEASKRLQSALSAEPVVSGLEWMGRTLYYNGRQLGMVIGLNDPNDQYETEIKWDYWLGLGGECNEEFDSEEKARAALEATALAWLSPVKQEPRQKPFGWLVRDGNEDEDQDSFTFYTDEPIDFSQFGSRENVAVYLSPPSDALREAAQAVVDRWDTPNWKDAEPTAHVIANLRQALKDRGQ